MKINRLKLTNFKGIKSLEITPNGEHISIHGDNGTGKTTIADAFSWLLYDKPSDEAANFSPKTEDGKGGYLHDLNHEVEAEITFSDKTTTLRKLFKEQYRTSGLEKSFTGHTTEYFIDGVPTKKKDYDQFISEICDVETAKVLTLPFYFSRGLSWQKRREWLSDLIPQITDEEIALASETDLTELTMLMKEQNLQMLEKKYKAEASRTKKALDAMPIRIDEASKAIPEIEHDRKNINKNAGDIALRLGSLREKLIFDTQDSDKLKQVANAEKMYFNNKREYDTNNNKTQMTALQIIHTTKASITENENKEKTLADEIVRQELFLEQKLEQRKSAGEEYKKKQSQEYDGSGNCPFCEQALPTEQIEKAKEKFNIEKAETLEKMRADAENNYSKKIIDELKANIDDLKNKLERTKEMTGTIKKQLAELEKANTEPKPYEETTLGKEQLAEIERLKLQSEQGNEKVKEELQKQIDELEQKQKEYNEILSMFGVVAAQERRLGELREEQKTLAKAHEEARRILYQIQQYQATTAELMTARVNGLFKNTQFKLFREQVNGDLEQICEPMPLTDKGYVTFANANNASRFNSGLDIIETISEKVGVKMPVFFDNAESVTKLRETQHQIIRLVVDENYKELTVV